MERNLYSEKQGFKTFLNVLFWSDGNFENSLNHFIQLMFLLSWIIFTLFYLKKKSKYKIKSFWVKLNYNFNFSHYVNNFIIDRELTTITVHLPQAHPRHKRTLKSILLHFPISCSTKNKLIFFFFLSSPPDFSKWFKQLVKNMNINTYALIKTYLMWYFQNYLT